jgi:hypothetical protein
MNISALTSAASPAETSAGKAQTVDYQSFLRLRVAQM